MKKMITQRFIRTTIFLLAIIGIVSTANAYDFEVEGIYYNITSNNTVKVTGGAEDLGEVIIPEIIIYNNKSYTVTAIDNDLFYNSLITSITIPRTVTSFNGLRIVDEEEGSIIINITDLAAWCNIDFFYDEIDSYMYTGGGMWSNNPLCFAHHLSLNGEEITDLVIPDTVTVIKPAAFLGCSHIRSVAIPQSLSFIGAAAFEGCNQLEKVSISNIESWVNIEFEPNYLPGRRWETYSGIDFTSNPLSYAHRLFIDDEELVDLVIPEGVTRIREAAFLGCSYLTSVTIPGSLVRVDSHAFDYCQRLNRVNISDLLSWLNIEFDCTIDYISGEDNYIYGVCLSCPNPLVNAHHLYLNDEEIIDLKIPNSISQIKNGAFWGCQELISISIPESVGKIGYASFYQCNKLELIECKRQQCPELSTEYYNPYDLDYPYDAYQWYDYYTDDGGFNPDYFYEFGVFPDYLYSKTTLQVPHNSIERYKSSSDWGKFVNIIGQYQFEVDGIYYYIIDDNTVCVTFRDGYYNSYKGHVEIPEAVSYEGVTYHVTSIGPNCFKDCDNLVTLSIPVTIIDIAESAFVDCGLESVYLTGYGVWQAGALPEGLKTLYIGSCVTGVKGMQVNPETIYSYATTPPVCDDNSFTGYGAELHVPASSLAAYFTAPYWCYFTNIIGDAVPLTDLALNQDSIEMLVGSTAHLTATLSPANAAPGNIIWQSSDTLVAKVENGIVSALERGECDITAVCQDKYAVCHVVVTEVLPTEVILSQEEAKLEVGTQLSLTAIVMPEDATNTTVTWTSTNRSVATVNNNGIVTAVGPGECNIIASCGNKQAICHVIVVEHLIYITLDQHDVSLLPNHMVTLTPTVTPVATDLVVTSSNPAVAAARMAGDKIQVVGIKEGVATIFVNSADGYAEPDSCRVKVKTERGDVNGDGFVSISDVTTLIDVLLGGATASEYLEENADCNNDGIISIGDVTILIDALLGGAVLPGKDTEEYTVNGVTFTMVNVQGGTFMMGATPEQGDEVRDNEKPVHQVTLSDYTIGQTEVTQELWLAVMGENPSHHTGDLQRPVEQVSWVDCQVFIARLNQLTGLNFRLPTEAEWEYAARGGNKSEGYMFAGSNVMDLVAWYSGNSSNTTHPVATKAPNELGLYDMTGNVWEWCHDWYKRYTEDPQVNPTGPATGNNRVLRGGCWNGGGNYNRISYRDNYTPTGSNSSGGLRLVLGGGNEEFTVNGVTFTMVNVPGGTFTMGGTPGQGESTYDDEFPTHQVTLTGYHIGQTEVTQALWVAVMGSNPSKYPGNLNRPVETVSWEDCQTFIATLNELTGRNFRLPTEAEWEFAARGGNLSHDYKYAGSNDLDEVGWYLSNLPTQQTSSEDYGPQPVAQKIANELGLFDMSGNVYEWTHDWYDAYSADPQVNPTGPGDDEGCHYRVCRGGAWTRNARSCRVTLRNNPTPTSAYSNTGLRLAL